MLVERVGPAKILGGRQEGGNRSAGVSTWANGLGDTSCDPLRSRCALCESGRQVVTGSRARRRYAKTGELLLDSSRSRDKPTQCQLDTHSTELSWPRTYVG